jgi:NADPH:quinone reductase-like Zn-dependent oxidoreductase
MQAAVVNSYDAPPVYASFADPVALEGEIPVTVTAAALHPIVRARASGNHYSSDGVLPFVPGVDGAGRLADGTRVYFGGARSPYGTFAERGIAPNWMCIPLPDGLDDATAAGIANPAMSGWVALTGRAKFVAGESVLVLGATGVAGQLAVQVAKRLGARRVIAAGRNAEALAKLPALGAAAVISLEQTPDALVAALREEIAESGVDVVLDYLWGNPAEAVIKALTQKGGRKASRVRYVEIGTSAGSAISLDGTALRSSGLELLGSGFGSASMEQIRDAVAELFKAAATKPFEFRIRKAPLSEIVSLWGEKEQGTRLVFEPQAIG